MVQAQWNDAVIAEASDTVVVEGNHYFARSAVKAEHLRESAQTSTCPWKGTAHYYDVVVDGAVNEGAAWYYPEPTPAAAEIKDRIAFWKGVTAA